jgi:hypothetical protein
MSLEAMEIADVVSGRASQAENLSRSDSKLTGRIEETASARFPRNPKQATRAGRRAGVKLISKMIVKTASLRSGSEVRRTI